MTLPNVNLSKAAFLNFCSRLPQYFIMLSIKRTYEKVSQKYRLDNIRYFISVINYLIEEKQLSSLHKQNCASMGPGRGKYALFLSHLV
jgi:hypothetical protein